MLLSDLLVDLYFYYVAARDSFTEFCDLFNLSLSTVANSKLAHLKVGLGQKGGTIEQSAMI